MIYKKDACELIYLLQNKLYPNLFENSGIIPDHTIIKKLDYILTALDVKDVDGKYFLDRIDSIKQSLSKDLEATYENDPAAKSIEEIIVSYPGFYATMIYRLAHEFYINNIPLLPRMMTEVAHSKTGIDIHPGATIQDYFFIDHGTGIVIGETTIIGNNVRIYQGVTLGALSLEHPSELRNKKRHPTIKDNVIIYAGASILGGNTIIGNNVTIGSNVFITKSIPDNMIVRFKDTNYAIKRKEG